MAISSPVALSTPSSSNKYKHTTASSSYDMGGFRFAAGHTVIPSQKGQEMRGRFVGFAWDVGHKLTFLVLTDDTRKVIKRSVLRIADCLENEIRLDENNLRLDKAAGKELRRKVNFTTAGRDPCLADGFIMKTLVPDEDKLNDVPPPDNDDDSVDAEIGATP